MSGPSMIGLDFETYSDVDLPVHGAGRYFESPHFQALCAGVFNGRASIRMDLVNHSSKVSKLFEILDSHDYIIGHNVGFEIRVLQELGYHRPLHCFIDSAVIARAAGAGSRLEAAAPQLLGVDKLESGIEGIRTFSIPGKYQEEQGTPAFDPQVVRDNPQMWAEFLRYCALDAELSYNIVAGWMPPQYLGREHSYHEITLAMNMRGWAVDVPVVKEMKHRYQENLYRIEKQFRSSTGAHDLNLNSFKQLKEWCAERGVRAKSFDEKNTAKMIKALDRKLPAAYDPASMTPKEKGLREVLELLLTKQELGGSSLKKLDVILNQVDKKDRLLDQYVHVGAGQTGRTSGRSAQMQNLKRLPPEPLDVSKLLGTLKPYDNETLAANIRQVFTSAYRGGRLIVGDLSSVESRGLAWLAGDRAKLSAFASGKDIYKIQASDIYNVPYEQVTKEQRQTGKVGELSCGYQAGGGAVQSFAEGMGVEMTEAEATELVRNWRLANPLIEGLWGELDAGLRTMVSKEQGESYLLPVGPGQGAMLRFWSGPVPDSLGWQLGAQARLCKTIHIDFATHDGDHLFRRVFHGVHLRGRGLGYFKPSSRKTGDLWNNSYTDPKTKQRKFYSIYGGKLSGILTQSLCREIFMLGLRQAHMAFRDSNVELVGQFHDEIVLDWNPQSSDHQTQLGLDDAQLRLEECMKLELFSQEHMFPEFPLGAEVNAAFRYIK